VEPTREGVELVSTLRRRPKGGDKVTACAQTLTRLSYWLHPYAMFHPERIVFIRIPYHTSFVTARQSHSKRAAQYGRPFFMSQIVD
jgi:hypothetical protein